MYEGCGESMKVRGSNGRRAGVMRGTEIRTHTQERAIRVYANYGGMPPYTHTHSECRTGGTLHKYTVDNRHTTIIRMERAWARTTCLV